MSMVLVKRKCAGTIICPCVMMLRSSGLFAFVFSFGRLVLAVLRMYDMVIR
jgi:hypothetical protein